MVQDLEPALEKKAWVGGMAEEKGRWVSNLCIEQRTASKERV